MKTHSAITFLAGLTVLATAAAQDRKPLTWADYHPALARTFAQPPVPWKCESVRTTFAASQPTVVLGLEGELVANAGSTLVHSIDGGRSWRKLCEVPVDRSIPDGYKLLAVNLDGLGITATGTILFHYTRQFNDGRPYDSYSKSFHAECYILRSTDRGRSWSPPVKLAAGGACPTA